MQYIEINKESLPERFDIDLGIETYTLGFNYNEYGDFFTCDLYRLDDTGEEETLVLGEKLVLNVPLFSEFAGDEFPAPSLIPMDLANNETRVSWYNLGKTVFLYIDDEGV